MGISRSGYFPGGRFSAEKVLVRLYYAADVAKNWCAHSQEHDGPIEKHPIFSAFRDGMQRLNDKGIPCHKYIVSAKSDSEMVYRGVLTMIKDY